MADGVMNIETFRKADELMRVCRAAVRKAQEESRRLGVANVYTFNGQRYYELPNGDYTRTEPKTVDAKNG
ncbi:MAG: hypothetical protein KY475_05405 [Planctomycetes bacterium]|nr:hypothetical protein [Planctomycetota bacterium]